MHIAGNFNINKIRFSLSNRQQIIYNKRWETGGKAVLKYLYLHPYRNKYIATVN